jgi:hypothetical protein
MNHQSEKSASLSFSIPQRAVGTVQRMDSVEREIVVLLPTGLAVFDVPSSCAIFLRGELVKFRVIQPGDRVRVTFSDCHGSKVAQMLEVPPNTDLPALGSQAATVLASNCRSSVTAGG